MTPRCEAGEQLSTSMQTPMHGIVRAKRACVYAIRDAFISPRMTVYLIIKTKSFLLFVVATDLPRLARCVRQPQWGDLLLGYRRDRPRLEQSGRRLLLLHERDLRGPR